MATKLVDVHRSGKIGINSFQDKYHYFSEQPVGLATLNDNKQIEVKQLDNLTVDGYNKDYFSPIGDRCIRINRSTLYENGSHLETAFTEIQCSAPLITGCFSDDIHFSVATRQVFQLFHTRSNTLVAEFYLENRDKPPTSLNQIVMRKL